MLEAKGGAGDILGGEFEFYVVRAEALEAIHHYIIGELRTVAFAAQVAEVEMAEVGRHDFPRGGGGVFVREMAVASGDALLEAPGPAGFLKHLQVVVGFEDKDVGGAHALEDGFRGVAEVGEKTDFRGAGVQEETDGVGGVMGNVERVHADIANLETGAGLKDATIKFGSGLIFDGFLRGAVAINGDAVLVGKAGQAADVVRVLVSDEDAVEFFGDAADAGEAFGDLSVAETGVNEQAGFLGLQIGAIAAGAAAEYRQLNSHAVEVSERGLRGQHFILVANPRGLLE